MTTMSHRCREAPEEAAEGEPTHTHFSVERAGSMTARDFDPLKVVIWIFVFVVSVYDSTGVEAAS
ncbi:hypothetical protein [Rhizobium laguerreae]|uniref:Uncharacterized protein n=1 Tax=Rhizobium laguerreae TaxID=1076926 RepID=A0A7Y2W7P0_9HYPH|nr:hypothetical protein [Rhizobium laguerreae]NNH66378.1 hypothetical protein [Rhizobium laguerreae]